MAEKEKIMASYGSSIEPMNTGRQSCVSSADLSREVKSNLTKLAAWINDRNVPFLIMSIGMIVMLLWGASYKMTAPGAEA
jgi:hypothetical protein